MTDAEFRRRAHALLESMAKAPESSEMETVAIYHDRVGRMSRERDALIAAGAYRSSVGLRAAIVAELDKDGRTRPYEIAERMDAPATAVPAIVRDLGLYSFKGSGEFFRLGPCTCDVVGHAETCKARPVVPVPPDTVYATCLAPCGFPNGGVCWLPKGHDGAHEGVPF